MADGGLLTPKEVEDVKKAERTVKFERIITQASRKELEAFKDRIDNEIRLSEIAISQGYEKESKD